MKRLLLFVATLAIFSLGCGSDESVESECEPFLKLSGAYVSDLTITENPSGDLLYEGLANVTIFQSGGEGTAWAGAIGTAKAEEIVVDAEWKVGGYELSVRGTANADAGTFDDSISNDRIDVRRHYEFRNVRERESNATGIPTLDFRTLGLMPLTDNIPLSREWLD